MIEILIKEGRQALQKKDLRACKQVAFDLETYLDIYVPSSKEWERINSYIQDLLCLENLSTKQLDGTKTKSHNKKLNPNQELGTGRGRFEKALKSFQP